MKSLQIANDYSGSKVYSNLFSKLDLLGLDQVVYTPIRYVQQENKNSVSFKQKDSKIVYSRILNLYTRINYKAKIDKVFKDIQAKTNLNEIEIIHAHTWFSDGGVAYELFKMYKISYVITVRNTDLNLFFKYMLHLRSYGLEILKNASRIIFISPIYKTRLYTHKFFMNYVSSFENKTVILPNGIDDFWLDNIGAKKEVVRNPLQLLYIGKFTKGKNVLSLLRAVKILNSNGLNCHLKLVGEGGSEFKKVMDFVSKNPFYSYLGKITDRTQLKDLFGSCDIFAMPSKAETFGLVYIEALSQGLPVIYTVNEGIYGFYNSTIGEAVDASNIESIANGIMRICNYYADYNFDPRKIVENHKWSEIAGRHLSLYEKCR